MQIINLPRLFKATSALFAVVIFLQFSMAFVWILFGLKSPAIDTISLAVSTVWYVGIFAAWFLATRWYLAKSPRGALAGAIVGFFYVCVYAVVTVAGAMILPHLLKVYFFYQPTFDAFIFVPLTALVGWYYGRKG